MPVSICLPSSCPFLITIIVFSLFSAPVVAVCGSNSALVDITPTLAISICADWQADNSSPTVVRVVRTPATSDYTAANVSLTRSSLMVQPSWPFSVPAFKVDRSRAGVVTVTTSQLRVSVNLGSLAIDFIYPSASAAPFLSEQSHSFAPDIDAASGQPSFVASSVWGLLSKKEAIYGGGSFQSGIIDFRNVPVNLVQFNTEVCHKSEQLP